MHTYILHITGFILKHGSSCIRNYNRNVRLTYSFHTSCSVLDMNDKEKIKESLEFINSFLTVPDEEDPRMLLKSIKNLLEL